MTPYRLPPPEMPPRPSDSLKPLGKATLSWVCLLMLALFGAHWQGHNPFLEFSIVALGLIAARASRDHGYINGRREEHEAWLRSFEPMEQARARLLDTLGQGTHWGGPR